MNVRKIGAILFAAFVGVIAALMQGCGFDRNGNAADAGQDAEVVADAGSVDAASDPDASMPDSGIAEDAGSDAATADAGTTCPTPYFGELLRAESVSAVYYISSDSRRYAFPADREFMTWFADFSGVRMTTDAEVATYPIAGNVRVRPGTRLIKIMTDPTVYAVTPCGIIREIESELLASQLYGAEWAMRVVDIPDAFFVNYIIGTPVTTPVHPDGQLIRYAGDANVYLMDGGARRLVSSRAFADSNFRTEFVIETAIAYPDGPPYSCAEPRFQEVVCASCGCPTP